MLTFQVTRQDPGNPRPFFTYDMEIDDPLLTEAVVDMGFWPETFMGRINYCYNCEVTLSFIDGQLNEEPCNFYGTTSSFPNAANYAGCATYSNLQEATPSRGLVCTVIGQVKLPRPTFDLNPWKPTELRVIQPTQQQLQNQEKLFGWAQTMVQAACHLIDQKGRL